MATQPPFLIHFFEWVNRHWYNTFIQFQATVELLYLAQVLVNGMHSTGHPSKLQTNWMEYPLHTLYLLINGIGIWYLVISHVINMVAQ